MSIGTRLKRFRKDLGLTQEKLGHAIGVKRGTYESYESGRVPPPDRALKNLHMIGFALTEQEGLKVQIECLFDPPMRIDAEDDDEQTSEPTVLERERNQYRKVLEMIRDEDYRGARPHASLIADNVLSRWNG